MRAMHGLAAAGLVLLSGCASADDMVGPHRADPAQYVLQVNFQYVCGRWFPFEPPVELGLFDVHFGRRSPADPETGPTEKHLKAILDAGGTIVHRFHVPSVRAVLPVRAVPSLDAFTRGVTDAEDLSLPVSVGFKSTVDPSVVSRRGGIITGIHSALGSLHAIVQDRVIPSIRSESSVKWVEFIGGPICLTSPAGP